MPIYEFACPNCRVIFNFLSKRMNPGRDPTCPKCGNKQMEKQLSRFAPLSGGKSEADPDTQGPEEDPAMSAMQDPRMLQAMGELERDMGHMDENNPRHMAHMMRKMKEIMPAGVVPKELDIAIKRLEAGEDPEKIEEDMGDILDQAFGSMDDDEDEDTSFGHARRGYARDAGLYDY
jgi:putative FmdB family regulatory protein